MPTSDERRRSKQPPPGESGVEERQGEHEVVEEPEVDEDANGKAGNEEPKHSFPSSDPPADY